MNGAGVVTIADNLGAYNRLFDASASSTTAATTLVLGAAPTTGVFGSSASATATLKRGTTAVVGQPVTFSIGGAQAVGVTNGSGVASASVPLTSVPGGYLLSAGFAGDATLLPSGDSHPFTITKLGTTLTLSGPASVPTGTPSGVVATLNAGTAPIAFKTVWFVLTGPTTITTTVLTDLAGKAAPIIAFGIALNRDLFAARIRCQIYQPIYGMDLAALCIKRQ